MLNGDFFPHRFLVNCYLKIRLGYFLMQIVLKRSPREEFSDSIIDGYSNFILFNES